MAGHRLVNDTGADVDAQLTAYLADLAHDCAGHAAAATRFSPNYATASSTPPKPTSPPG